MGLLQSGLSGTPGPPPGRGSSQGLSKISVTDFLEMKWLDGLAWGAKAAIKPKLEKDVRYALQLMAQAGIPESTIFTHLGWRKIGDSWAYLHAGGAVGSEAVEVEINR